MTPEELAVYIPQKKQEAEVLISRARDFARLLFTSNAYTTYLTLMSKFHRYSYLNILLIQAQFSDASYVSGYDTWKTVANDTYNNPNYQILLKEHMGKGIKILIPFTVTADARKHRERSLINFPVTVYDISQTNKLPNPDEDSELDISLVDKHLMEAIREHGPYRFVLADAADRAIRNGARSYYDRINQFIVVNMDLAAHEQIIEYIRTWASKEAAEFIQRKSINPSYSGFIVSSIDYVVRSALGLNTHGIAFNYVSQYATANEVEFLQVLHCIQSISHNMIEALTDGVLDIDSNNARDFDMADTIYDYPFWEETDT